jgi:3-hydroxy acid dehydrogenase/malonic semialdehyde reductase
MINLKGKTVLITGASAGIGKACAHVFAANGARLIICARRLEKLNSLALELSEKYGIRVQSAQLDVSDADMVQQFVPDLPNEWKEIDILINNAGKALGFGASFNQSLEHIDGMLNTNVKGVLYMNKAIIPGMIDRNKGHVITIGSVAGRWVYPGGTVYCASKHAVKAINEGLKMDVHGTPIRVSSVDPGLVETEFSEVRFEGDTEKAATVYAGLTPLAAEDVAESVLYCATRPAHININEISLMCVDQSAATMVNRRSS